jgi:phytoene synthase
MQEPSENSPQLRDSYAFCRRFSRHAHSSFYASFCRLPPAKRRAMHALYAFMRYSDDLGDNDLPTADRRAALHQWRGALDEALVGRLDEKQRAPFPSAADHDLLAGGRPLLPALADTVRQFSIPAEYLHAVIDGQEMDLDAVRYDSFAQLAGYCEKVASAVGLACIHVWGIRGAGALEPARKCGIAFQLTNILRDLQEDAARGRVYLPGDDLRQCGYSADELARGVVDDRFRALVAMEIGRARRLYDDAAELRAWLDRDGRRIFGMMHQTYRQLLETIAGRVDALFQGRVRVSRWRKMQIAARWLVLP